MTLIALLFVLGIVLLVLEVFVPGAVLGVLGGIAMFVGCVISFSRFGVVGGGLATLVALALLGIALYVEFVLLPKTRVGKKFFLHKSVDATSQPPVADAAVIGKAGVASTTLAPSGYVVIEQRRYEAFSRSGLIAKGATVRVVEIDNFRLIVSQL